jgi:hypothetical protein
MKEKSMKKTISFLLIILFEIILLSGCSTQAEIKSTPKYTISGISHRLGAVPSVSFDLSSPLPNFPDKLPVYKMVKPEINEEYVKNLGAKFDLTGDISEGTENYLLKDNQTQTSLEVYKPTGTFWYHLRSYFRTPTEDFLKNPPVLPSDAEALKIATDFLVQRDLLPKGDVAYRVEVGDSSGDLKIALLVSFQHEVEITGPGARHGVRIGDGGKVVEVFINPTNPLDLPVQEMVAVKSAQQAYDEVRTVKNFHAPSEARKVKIESVTVTYWLEAIGEGQEYVVPVYKFKGQCLDEAGKLLEGSFVSIIEALK